MKFRFTSIHIFSCISVDNTFQILLKIPVDEQKGDFFIFYSLDEIIVVESHFNSCSVKCFVAATAVVKSLSCMEQFVMISLSFPVVVSALH